MFLPKERTAIVTSIQDMMKSNRHNITHAAEVLKVNRATVRSVIDNNRKHVVLVEDGVYTLLK